MVKSCIKWHFKKIAHYPVLEPKINREGSGLAVLPRARGTRRQAAPEDWCRPRVALSRALRPPPHQLHLPNSRVSTAGLKTRPLSPHALVRLEKGSQMVGRAFDDIIIVRREAGSVIKSRRSLFSRPSAVPEPGRAERITPPLAQLTTGA